MTAPYIAGAAIGPVALSRAALLALAGIALLIFGFDVWLALRMRASGALFLSDIFFDADPFRQIGQLAYAMPVPGAVIDWLPNDVHPLVPYMAIVFLQVGARIWSFAVGDGARIVPYLRETLSLLISPLCLSLACFVFGRMLARLGFATPVVLGGAILLGFSYSSLIFGGMPEHFAMSMLAIVALMAWAASWLQHGARLTRQGYVAWGLLSAFAIGITVTNGFAAFAMLAAVELQRERGWNALRRAAGLAIAVGIGVAVVGGALVSTQISLAGYEVQESGISFLGDFSTYDAASIADRLWRLLNDSLQAICAVDLDRVGPLHAWSTNSHPDVIVPTHPRDLSLVGLLVLGVVFGLVVSGAVVGVTGAPAVRVLSWAGLAMLAQTIAMHSVFGTVMMLYTQHFLAVLVFFVVISVSTFAMPRGSKGIAIAACLLVLVAANNVTFTFRTLALADQIVADYKSKKG